MIKLGAVFSIGFLALSGAASAACNPSGAPAGSAGCQPVVTSGTSDDTVSIWQPHAFPGSANQIAPGNLLVPANGTTQTLTAWISNITAVTNQITLGTGVGNTLGPLINWGSSGFPGLKFSSRMILSRVTTTPADVYDLQLVRQTYFAGGSSSNINSLLDIGCSIGSADATSEWCGLTTITTNGTAGGNAVGHFMQATKAAGATDGAIAAISDMIDLNDVPSGSSGAAVASHEFDLEVNQGDNGTNGATWGGTGQRKMAHFVASRKNASDTTQTVISNGIWFSTQAFGIPGSDPYTNYQSAIGVTVNTQMNSLVDARGAIAPTGSSYPVNAVTMTAGQVVDFNGGSTMTTAPGNYFKYNSGAAGLQYFYGAQANLTLHNSGAVNFLGSVGAGGVYSAVNGFQASNNADEQMRLLTTGGIDLRMEANDASSAGVIGTYSNNNLAVQTNATNVATFYSGGGVVLGNASLSLTAGDVGLVKRTASGTSAGVAGAKLELVCGTNAGTAKLIIYAGTSTSPVTISDNIGAGVAGC